MELAKITIELTPELVAKIAEDIEGTSFKNVEAFVADLVKKKYPELRRERDYTEEEEKIIRDRLVKLGYIE